MARSGRLSCSKSGRRWRRALRGQTFEADTWAEGWVPNERLHQLPIPADRRVPIRRSWHSRIKHGPTNTLPASIRPSSLASSPAPTSWGGAAMRQALPGARGGALSLPKIALGHRRAFAGTTINRPRRSVPSATGSQPHGPDRRVLIWCNGDHATGEFQANLPASLHAAAFEAGDLGFVRSGQRYGSILVGTHGRRAVAIMGMLRSIAAVRGAIPRRQIG